MAAQALVAQTACVGRVNTTLGGGENFGVDVGAQDRHVRVVAQGFGDGHGQRVGLFPGGGGVAPQAQVLVFVVGQFGGQHGEVVLFAKEGGEVGGEAVDKLLPLLLAPRAAGLLQPVQVVAKGAVPHVAQATREAAVHHGALALVQTDARTLVDELANALEIGRVETELGFAELG